MKLLRTAAGRATVSGLLNLNYRLRRLIPRESAPATKNMETTMSDTQAMFEEMVGRFSSSAANGLDVVFQYKLDEGDAYFAAISEGNCALEKGEHDEPSVVLLMDNQTFSEVLSGETNGMQAFMSGRIRAEGDIMLATRLEALFPVG
jgi:putative sterol carrier protein